MKRDRFKKLLCYFLVVLIAMTLLGCTNETKQTVEEIELNTVNLAKIKEGKYIGECVTKFVKATMEVQVKEHKIVKVNILEHDNFRGKKAERIVESVITNQGVKVDLISGATVSSKVILKAIENALRKGL